MQRHSLKMVFTLITVIFLGDVVYAMQPPTRWRRPLPRRRRIAKEIELPSLSTMESDELRPPSPSFWRSNSDSEKEKEPEEKEETLPQPARIISSYVELMQPKTVFLQKNPYIEEVLMAMRCVYADESNCRQGFHTMEDMMRHIISCHRVVHRDTSYEELCTIPIIVSAEKF